MHCQLFGGAVCAADEDLPGWVLAAAVFYHAAIKCSLELSDAMVKEDLLRLMSTKKLRLTLQKEEFTREELPALGNTGTPLTRRRH
jgi:hypothetical protein